MARARAKQSDNRVSMEAATSLGGRRKALAAQRSKTELAVLRECAQGPSPSQGAGDQSQDCRRTEEDSRQRQGQDTADRPATD